MAQKTLTRSGLAQQISQQLLIPKNQASILIEAIINQLFESLNETSSLKISSFGTFLVHKKQARMGRNPKTGTEALITPRKSVSFRTSQILKSRINRRMKRENI